MLAPSNACLCLYIPTRSHSFVSTCEHYELKHCGSLIVVLKCTHLQQIWRCHGGWAPYSFFGIVMFQPQRQPTEKARSDAANYRIAIAMYRQGLFFMFVSFGFEDDEWFHVSSPNLRAMNQTGTTVHSEMIPAVVVASLQINILMPRGTFKLFCLILYLMEVILSQMWYISQYFPTDLGSYRASESLRSLSIVTVCSPVSRGEGVSFM